ncbi:ABC transporter [Amycolatopsis rhizosphaerae]|uniref:ABC transporter n=1 Tax=Amycolatopsis rhizosphaerae TaxID=2053003 RepID=A0A558A039_9PSEU|nr:YhgE/Pip domain-containing protein [Amycolatopsis rhizosphaerae]TVT17622.1 ABC transporter [Amycolatopsis rhizosphaerae]
MTALGLALLELRRFRGPWRRFVPLLLCLVPLLCGVLYLWANWDPYRRADRIPVAVVNADLSAFTQQGERVDAGRQLARQLKAAGTFDWHFVGPGEAHDGLAKGRYYFTVTIPADFSARLATAGDPDPQRAGIVLGLNDANNYLAGIMTEVVQPQLQEQINAAVHASYVKALYGELSGVRAQLATASDGARHLVDTTRVAQEGAKTLVSGTGALQQGAGQVGDGLKQINQGVAGLDALTTGLTRATAAELPAAAATLVDAANQTAQGLAAVRAGTSLVKDGTARAVANLNQLAGEVPGLRDHRAYQAALADAEQLDAAAGRIDGEAAAAAANAQEALHQARQLQGGIGAVQRRVLDAAAPVQLIDTGARTATTGANTLTGGLATLHQGAGTMQTAAGQAHDGATDLGTVVTDALSEIPPTSPEQVAHAASVLGSPVDIGRTNLNPAGPYGRGLAPFLFSIALWIFGLVACLLLRPVNPRALAGRVPAVSIAVGGWLPGAMLGVVAALILYAVAEIGLGLHPRHAAGTVLLLAVAAAGFVAVAHFLRTALGAFGDVLSLVLLIVQLTSCGGLYPMPTTPQLFQALNPLLPMTYLVDGLRVTLSGGLAEHLLRDFVVLGAYTVLFLAATSLVVTRRRLWRTSGLHPDVQL